MRIMHLSRKSVAWGVRTFLSLVVLTIPLVTPPGEVSAQEQRPDHFFLEQVARKVWYWSSERLRSAPAWRKIFLCRGGYIVRRQGRARRDGPGGVGRGRCGRHAGRPGCCGGRGGEGTGGAFRQD